MIMYGPGFMGGRAVNELASLIDIPATLLDCGGIDVPEYFHGRPLGRMINDKNAVWDDSVFIQISESHVGRCVRTKKWKYSVRADADGWEAPDADVYYEDYLYDLENDPHERNNLAGDPGYAAVRAELSDKLIGHMIYAGEAAPKILPMKPLNR
jgi:uncharacterized sulfatase